MKGDIKIVTSQTACGEKASFATNVFGSYEKSNGIHTVKYTEIFEGGELQTVITVKNRVAVIERLNSTPMTVEAGKAHACEYDTGYGVIPLEVRGIAVSTKENGNSFTLKLKYRLFNGGEEASLNEITLTFLNIQEETICLQ